MVGLLESLCGREMVLQERSVLLIFSSSFIMYDAPLTFSIFLKRSASPVNLSTHCPVIPFV